MPRCLALLVLSLAALAASLPAALGGDDGWIYGRATK